MSDTTGDASSTAARNKKVIPSPAQPYYLPLTTLQMKTVICLLALLCPLLSSCQRLTITGQVHDIQGKPITQARVTLLRTGQHHYTSPSGRFSFSHTYATDSLRISAVGYITATVTNNARGRLSIQLQPLPGGQQVTPAISSTPAIRPLTIGDTLPDITLTGLVNYKDTVIRLKDLKGKMLLFDFWETSCASCLLSLPTLDSLQKQYPDALQVITVTSITDKDRTLKVFNQRKFLNGIQLPIVIEDTLLRQLFPHTFISHVVWVDTNQVITAFTGSEYLKPTYLQQMQEHRTSHWIMKYDLPFDKKQPLTYYTGNQPVQPITDNTLFTARLPGLAEQYGFYTDSTTRQKRFYVINANILRMYYICMPDINLRFTLYPQHRQLEVSDTSLYLPTKIVNRAEWDQQHSFSYQSTWPMDTDPAVILRQFKLDIDKHFGLYGRIEKRTDTSGLERLVFVLTEC